MEVQSIGYGKIAVEAANAAAIWQFVWTTLILAMNLYLTMNSMSLRYKKSKIDWVR
jgi:hypothetical protein